MSSPQESPTNSDSSSPPPQSDDSSSSPPPPSDSSSSSSKNNKNDNASPPSPPSDDAGDGDNNGDSSSSSYPPPPHSSSSSSSLSSLPNNSNNNKHKSKHNSSSDNNGLTDNEKAMIAGVAAGAGLLLLILIVFIISCCRRRKSRRKPPHDQMHYYTDNNSGATAGGGAYYHQGGGQNNGNWQNNNNVHPHQYSGEHHMVMMPPSGVVSSEYGWPMGPPPPPPMMSSSEMSSAAFSGPHQHQGMAMAPPPPPTVALGGFNQSSFTYNDLAAATGGFSQSNLLGQGGFGYVHKGVLPNGKDIAVKSLKSNSGQGEREFQAEVEIISRVHHRHLVSLVGYCIAGPQRMLVYEFVSNNTLEYHLHGTGRPIMDFPTRLQIALGSAKGFAYLHEDCHPRIIHRDIKAANILLEDNFDAKVADFGLAKLSSDNNTHVSTRIMGTFGYLAPEYASSGKLTEKSDVYSYGVMLLELITGRRPIDVHNDDEDTLVDWARPILTRASEGGSFEEVVDPRLEKNYDPQEMKRMVVCAGACIRHSARRRPKMSQIVRALEGDVSLDDLNNAAKTENNSTAFSSRSNSEYDLNKLAPGKSSALSSQEFSSGEHH